MCLSGNPFSGPVGAVRVALVDGKLVANPTYKPVAAAPLELVRAGNEDAILMVESGGKEVSEEQMLEALAFGHERCKELTRIQKDLIAKAAKPRWAFDAQAGADPALEGRVKELASAKVVQALAVHEKQAPGQALDATFEGGFAAVGGGGTLRAKNRGHFEKGEKTGGRRPLVGQ